MIRLLNPPRKAALLKFLVAASLLPLLGACAPDFDPPPGYQGGFLWNSDKSRTVDVEPGDSLYAISQRYDVPIKVIVARNALRPPYALIAGQELVLDPVRTHRVVNGETLDGIAGQYGVDVALIAEANDLQRPYAIHPDQDLWIPDPFTVAAATSVPAPAALSGATYGERPQFAAGVQVASAAPSGGSAVSVETLAPPPGTPVAPDFAAPPQQISQPPIPPPILPQGSQPPAAPGATGVPAAPQAVIPQTPAPSAPQPVLPQTPAPPAPQPVLPQIQPPATPQSAEPQTPQPPLPAPPAAPAPQSLVAPPNTPTQLAAIPPSTTSEPVMHAAARFIWPVKGRLISGFGPAGKGLHNDGINIAAPLGTQVRAVDNGVVAYAGNELKGFGNLLLIKHADGLTTAYAHNEKLLVTKGDTVKQGQVVATVGKTGGVDSPQLHFEVRVGTQAVDPEEYLLQAASH